MLRLTASTAVHSPFPSALENEREDVVVDRRTAFFRPAWQPADHNPVALPSPPSPLVTKLQNFGPLEDSDIEALTMISASPKTLCAGHIVMHERSAADHVNLIVQGMACRYKLLPGGQRQILGFLLPGDLCDIHPVTWNNPDHSVALLGVSEVVKVPTRRIVGMLANHPRIERALALSALLDIAILREWLLNVGQRNALEKLAHFFCEMKVRLEAIGHVAADGSFDMPVNQSALADTTGLTAVHINRTLQKLRSDGLIQLSKRRLSILEPDKLAAVAGFDPTYLRIIQCQRMSVPA